MGINTYIERVQVVLRKSDHIVLGEFAKVPKSFINKEEYVIFPSKGEFRCYLFLKEYFRSGYTIELQSKVILKSCSWKIDFKIIGNTAKTAECLQDIAISLGQPSLLDHLYFEYKGIKDKNFEKKYIECATYNPLIDNALILVGNKCDAYGFYNPVKQKIICKPIYSIEILKKFLQKVIL